MIKPLNGNILVKKELKENKTKSGILLTEKEVEEEYAIVIALSDVYADGKKVPLEISVGDKVLFKNYGSTKVKYNDEEYLLVEYKDIIGVID